MGMDTVPVLSIIDKMGVGPEILRLRAASMSQAQIAERMNLDVKAVNTWLARYENMDEGQRQDVTKRSIFNVAENMQWQFERLYSMLHELRMDGNYEMELRAHAEYRQLIRQAGDLIEKLHVIKQMERLKEAILDVIEDEAPGLKVKILRKLAENKDYFSVIHPM